ncbi:hypothetical protein K3495_g7566 [Podosphaera aphanis]|nr:hypothetical protein K3495_g7566 [Podosphaera aphanis]
MNIENILNDEHAAKILKKSAKRERRVVKQLREILGRIGKGPVNYKKLAEEIKVEVSLMDLFQISPDLSKEFQKLSTRVNARTMKERMKNELPKTNDAKFDIPDDVSDALFVKAAGPNYVTNERAFRIPVTVKTKKDGKPVKVSLPENMAQAAQRSDMIIVNIGFLEKFGIPVQSLSSRGMNGLTMNVADGILARLAHYAQYEI